MNPKSINADRAAATLTVTWMDGSVSVLPFRLLSDLCPCELCDHERKDDNPLKILRPRSYELAAINPVGSYAVNIVWEGGCHYGIYSWDYLRRLGRMADSASGA